jgi:pimeloyl-ACP methyl ester carboxylesterase
MQMTSFHSSTNAFDLNYIRAGIGPDVLMIHGWASSSRMWSALMTALASERRSWAIDLAGFGGSGLPAHIRPDLDAQLAWLIRFLEQRQIRPSVVIGHSMGGLLALKLAHERPDLAERLVLMCPVVTGRFGLNAHQLFGSRLWMMMAARTQRAWTVAQSTLVAPLISAPMYLSPRHRARYVQDFRRSHWDAAMAALESISLTSMQPHLSEIRQPALVVVGSRDFTVSPEEGRLAARLMPNAELVEFPQAHHQPLDEMPERFIKLTRDFVLRSNDPL